MSNIVVIYVISQGKTCTDILKQHVRFTQVVRPMDYPYPITDTVKTHKDYHLYIPEGTLQ